MSDAIITPLRPKAKDPTGAQRSARCPQQAQRHRNGASAKECLSGHSYRAQQQRQAIVAHPTLSPPPPAGRNVPAPA